MPAKRRHHNPGLADAHSGHLLWTESQVADLYEAKGLGPAAGNGWYTADKDEPICVTMERLGTLPFVAQPGEAFVYGYNTDILGCVVEKASGMPLDEFIRTRITEPLGMKDTRFFLPPAERGATGRRLRQRQRWADRPCPGRIERARLLCGRSAQELRRRRGLTSTARDYARFLEMIRNGGVAGRSSHPGAADGRS